MATIERDEIMDDFKERLKTVTGVELVTRNWRKYATNETRPALFILDRTDQVQEVSGRGVPSSGRNWQLWVAVQIEGTTDEAAPQEMDDFVKLVRKAVFVGQSGKIGTRSKIQDGGVMPLVFPKGGNKVVSRLLMFTVFYRDDVAELFS